jgi:hypothetical protein
MHNPVTGIYKIWYYKRRTKKLRAKAGLPQLYDADDLPDPIYDPNYVHVLTDDEQNDLHKRQYSPFVDFLTVKLNLTKNKSNFIIIRLGIGPMGQKRIESVTLSVYQMMFSP